MKTLEMVRRYMGNEKITIDSLDEVRLEETGQTLGAILTGESAVREHLRILTMDNGGEWHGVETASLHHGAEQLREGLRYLGENCDGNDVWYQAF